MEAERSRNTGSVAGWGCTKGAGSLKKGIDGRASERRNVGEDEARHKRTRSASPGAQRIDGAFLEVQAEDRRGSSGEEAEENG